ncbi:MAG: polysaccharide ABC transporter ATP-binding protein [Verrucomicrobiia bacterium]
MTATIRVEGLSKRYLISHRVRSGGGLRHVIEDAVKGMWRRGSRGEERAEEFWALDDVSFEVRPGEVLGIIGRNGAGKSTLLKILSRITEPTRGRVTIEGRVASLLEVGTGFHPELTGRENIYLNGAILGMTRGEIRSKFDQIVAFAEVERFLDTPVKRYSSGMYVRLAFAVAAHLDPEILIVDEVLAVGDTQFQKKCLGKMEEVSRSGGRTVLFVSHNMGVVQSLCSRSLFMAGGRIKYDGASRDAIACYLAPEATADADGMFHRRGSHGSGERFFERAWLEVEGFIAPPVLSWRQAVGVVFVIHPPRCLERIELSVRIIGRGGQAVFTSLYSQSNGGEPLARLESDVRFVVEVPGRFLMPGGYTVDLAIHEPVGRVFDQWISAISFEVADDGSPFARYGGYHDIGVVTPFLPWKTMIPGNDSEQSRGAGFRQK